MSPYVEPCEICRFSSYVNVDGEYFPCSFVEGLPGWEHGINVLDIQNEDDFIKKKYGLMIDYPKYDII